MSFLTLGAKLTILFSEYEEETVVRLLGLKVPLLLQDSDKSPMSELIDFASGDLFLMRILG